MNIMILSLIDRNSILIFKILQGGVEFNWKLNVVLQSEILLLI